jgi:hypothetical protein
MRGEGLFFVYLLFYKKKCKATNILRFTLFDRKNSTQLKTTPHPSSPHKGRCFNIQWFNIITYEQLQMV